MKNYIAKRFQNISGGLSLDTEALSPIWLRYMVKYGENTITSSPGSSSAIMVSPMPMQLEAVTNRFSLEISMEKSSLYAFMTASISSGSPWH